MVGDRLDTDIAGAHAVDIPSLWVGTGVDRPAELVNAPPDQRPTQEALDPDDMPNDWAGVSGEWTPPPSLARDPLFRGYVVFLTGR